MSRWIVPLLALLLAVPFSVAAQPSGGESVGFETQDPQRGALRLSGMLWTPAGTPRGAVVLVHGSGGWSDHREGHYGRALAAAGYLALAIDSFGTRGIRNTVEDQAQISALQMTRDAFAARRWLLARGADPQRTAVMGFSKGGTVALYAADRNFVRGETERFQLAIPFYPGCGFRPRVPQPAAALFMALGDKDDYTGVKPCQDLADDFARAGGRVTVKVYAGAAHAFDGNPDQTRMIYIRNAENYLNCTVYVEEDGRLEYAGKTYPANDPALLPELRRTCVTKGASVWTHQANKAAATRDAIAFLDAAFVR